MACSAVSPVHQKLPLQVIASMCCLCPLVMSEILFLQCSHFIAYFELGLLSVPLVESRQPSSEGVSARKVESRVAVLANFVVGH